MALKDNELMQICIYYGLEHSISAMKRMCLSSLKIKGLGSDQ